MSRRLLDDCFLHDRDRLKHDEAIAILKARVSTVADVEVVGLIAASGRTLAAAAVAARPVPLHTNAAVDGFAFAAEDYDQATGKTFPVRGRLAAGRAVSTPVARGHAVRIFTGAALPPGVDTVAMQEDCRVDADNGSVSIPGGLKAGANVRKAGEDVAAHAELMPQGQVIRPQDLAGLASIGLDRVTVYKRLRVGILSSGDEVVRPGAPIDPGQVYDANWPMLTALIASAGAEWIDLGVAADDGAVLQGMLREAASRCDVIITSGGASKGEEDHLIAAIDALGKRHLWQLAIKPGRPMSFGQIGDCVILGLPGNPVAVFVCFLLYAWPLLRRMGGAAWPEPFRYQLPAAFAFADRKTGRREYWRGMHTTWNGHAAVDKFARDGSGLISGLRAADGLIEVPEDTPSVRPGDPVTFIPFASYGF